MGYKLYQPAPSPGRLPVDAPKRYGWGAPARPTSRAAWLPPAGPGAAVRTPCLGFVVLAFYFVLCQSPERCPALGEQSRALPAARLHPAPQRPPVSVLRASHPRCAHARRRPGHQPRGELPGPGLCVQYPGARPHFRASRQERSPERVRFSEVPGPGAKAGEGVLPSRAGGGWVEERCFRSARGLGSGVPQIRWGSKENLLLSVRGLGSAQWSAGNL